MGWLPVMGLAMWVVSASAEPSTCPPDDGTYAPETRQMRAASLAIRGVIPTPEEYEALGDEGLTEAELDAWLDSEAFTAQVVRHHRSLFWNNTEDVDLIDNDSRLDDIDDIYFLDDTASLVRRGVNDGHCGDFEATYDSVGQVVQVESPEGVLQEGWVWVAPYWDLDNPIKVCALDAQTEMITRSGTDCTTRDFEDDPDCGCGPNLQWCRVNGIELEINLGFAADMDLRVARIMDEDLSYLDLFSDNTGFVNGPMVHFYKHHLGKPDDIEFRPGQVDEALLPDLAFTDVDTFVSVNLGSSHAGVLTSPSWLIRFQTNRSRANQFYNSFLCQPFQPPDGGLVGLDDPNPTLDLTARTGCDYCHALLEPAAAHWGRWPEAGAGFLDPAEYPPFDPACEACSLSGGTCPDACDDLYLVEPISSEQLQYVGWLRAYEFLEDRHMENVEEGPNILVNATVADGRFPTCVATRTAEWLTGREMTESDQEWLDELASEFSTSEFRYRELVKQVILSDNFRRVQ